MNKFLYFGTPYVARDTLVYLVERGFVPEAVITSPDAPKGRGLALAPSATKEWALAHDLPVLAPEKLDGELIESLRSYGAEYAIVVAYGKILPQTLIDLFPKGVLNVHYSLLPKYRGASPVESALLHGETTTGVSIQKMVLRLDAGDVIAQEEVAIRSEETTRELRPRLVTEGARLLADILPAYERGELAGVPQDEAQATHFGKIEKKEGELDLAGNAESNWNKYRAYAESPGTYFFAECNGARIRVKVVTATYENGKFVPLRVVPEGRREIDYADFVRS
ncbi:MAG TPA: methionyl-tRNA formyltransferase [Candidatus Paceibacterota bacterium]|nr:methionyl-tRNA formyltransferase [Candidatus Paceibacterota bacterium]